MIGVRIILVLFLFTAASGQRHGEYSLAPVTVELDDIVMNTLDELAPHVNESNCKLELVKIFETLIQVVDRNIYMFNIEIFCPDNQRSRVCTNVIMLKPTDCKDKDCLIDPKDIECITILTGKNSSVLDHYSLTPVTIEIRKVVLESLDQLAEILYKPGKCKLELVNIFSAVAQAAEDITSYVFDIEVYCPRSKVSIVCANVKVYQIHEKNNVEIKDPIKIQFFTIKTVQDNSADGSFNVAPFTIGMNNISSIAVNHLSWYVGPRCKLELVKVFEVLVQNIPGFVNLYMFDIEVYCPSSNVSKVCTNVKVLKLNYSTRTQLLTDSKGIQCITIKTGKHSPVLDNYSLTPITIEIRKVVSDILHPLALIFQEPDCKLRLINIFVAVAKVTQFDTEYMFDINVYCPTSKVSKVCVNVKVQKNVLIEPEGIHCIEISTIQ